MMIPKVFIILMLMFASTASLAAEIRVAVASNFTSAMAALVKQFEANTGDKVILVYGSTGKHYAQIINGAPFDAFFAADRKRPRLLEKEGFAVAGSRFTYAVGKLILWSPLAGVVDPAGKVLSDGNFYHLAIANPKLAPYGRAAKEVLQSRGLWIALRGRTVRGENIGQAFQYVMSGNAELGFIANSQVKHPGKPVAGSYWLVPQNIYSAIDQQAVLLQENATARRFLAYMKTQEALTIINDHGYETR